MQHPEHKEVLAILGAGEKSLATEEKVEVSI